MTDALRIRLSRVIRKMGSLYPTDNTTPSQRTGMRFMWLNNLLASISGAFYGDFVVIYLVTLGATATTIGLRSSIGSAAALLAPLLGAWLVERTGKRKRWVLMWPGTISRLALLAMAAIPFFLQGNWAVGMIVALIAIQSFSDTLSGPAANSLFGDIVPVGVRGRFLGLQNIVSNVVGIAIVPLAGLFIKRIGGVSGYQLAWLMATLVGFSATWSYSRIPEPPSQEKRTGSRGARQGSLEGWQVFARDRRFITFCLVNFVWNFGVNSAGPFFTVHQIQDLGFGVETLAVLATATRPVNVVAFRLAGDLVDRKGAQRIMSLSMLAVPLVPILWMLARTPLQVGLSTSYQYLAWSGFNVAITPLLLAISPPEFRSRYLAIFATINSLSAIIAPLAGSWVYQSRGFSANCVLSAVGRGMGAVLFWMMIRQGFFADQDQAVRSSRLTPRS
jgi:MFS family permease